MIGASREHTVIVWGASVPVTVAQRSKSVWVAVGEYMGQHLEVKSSSEGSALKLWRSTAEYRGN
jgi:hypothetical protein